MAMRPCRECGNQISSKASTCPHCGLRNPSKSAGCAQAVLVILMLPFLALITLIVFRVILGI